MTKTLKKVAIAPKVGSAPASPRPPSSAAVPSPNLLSLFPDYRRRQYRDKDNRQRDAYLCELADAYKHKGLVLYVGAGVSRSVGLPSWPELIRLLTLNMMTRKVKSAIRALGGMSDDTYWETIIKMQENFDRCTDYERPLLMMARAIKDELGQELPYAIARYLYRRGMLNSTRVITGSGRSKKRVLQPRNPPTSPLVDSLIALARAERGVEGVQAIVNYNYDDILDEKLRGEKVRCVTVKSGHDHVPEGALPCYHVHGVIPLAVARKENALGRKGVLGNFVFSEDEYHAEYSDPYKWSNMTQISLLGRYTGLFVGLSLEDPNIRRLIDVTHRQYPDTPNYAILPRKASLAKSKDSADCVVRNLFEDVEAVSYSRIGVKVIWTDDFNSIPSVVQKICANKP
jgi:hypothetical protein